MVACLYIPDFPAWAFEQAAASYAAGVRVSTSPLVVVAAGHVLSANRQAQRAGIVSGITVMRAKSLSPELRIHLRDGDLEEAVWEEVLLKVNQVTPFIENSVAPFVYFKPGAPGETRALIKQLRAKAGIASHRTFARLASIRAANGNLLVLPDKIIQSFLLRFPVDSLDQLNFDADLIERLTLFGYSKLGDVRTLSNHHLISQFGNDGARLHKLLHPEKEPPIKLFELPPTVKCSLDLDDPLAEPGELQPVLNHLIRIASTHLQGKLSQRVSVSVCYRGESTLISTCRILGTATDKTRSLLRAAELLLGRLLGPEKQIETLQIQLGALRYAQPLQTTLFRERPTPYSAIKAVHRHHPGLIKKAILQPGALFTDEMVRLEPWAEEEKKRIPRRKSL